MILAVLYLWLICCFWHRRHSLFQENEHQFPQNWRLSWYIPYHILSLFSKFSRLCFCHQIACLCMLISCLDCSNWSNIFSHGFCLYLAGMRLLVKIWSDYNFWSNSHRKSDLSTSICVVAGSQPGWYAFIIQSGFWGRCSKWCNISGAFPCNSEHWPISHQLKHCSWISRKLSIFVYLKHHTGSSSNSLPLSIHVCARMHPCLCD